MHITPVCSLDRGMRSPIAATTFYRDMSPEDSNLMFSLPHSPPHPQQRSFGIMDRPENVEEMLSSTFSPSIFSPPEKKSSSGRRLCDTESPVLFRLDESSRESDEHSTVMDVDHSGPMNTPKSSAPLKMKFSKPQRRTSRADGAVYNALLLEDQDNNHSSGNSRRIARKLSLGTTESRSDSESPDVASRFKSRRQSTPTAKSVERAERMDDSDDDSSPQTEGPSHVLSPKSVSSCNCKKSKCLKLYCDCFAILQFCDPDHCKCQQCNNTESHEVTRNNAIRMIKDRNPRAFRMKINEEEQQHVSGCHCKNSHCLKKYCECFTAGALCGTNCKCLSCDNYSGSEELLKLKKAQGASPAILSMISPSSSASWSGSIMGKKRKESPNGVASLLGDSPILGPGHDKQTAAKRSHSVPGHPLTPSPGTSIALLEEQTAPKRLKRNPNESSRSTELPSTFYSRTSDVGQPSPLSMDKRMTRASSARERGQPPHTACLSSPSFAEESHQRSRPESHESDHFQYASKQRLKTKKVRFANSTPVVYPFFGAEHPPTTKLTALKVLDFLSCKDLYTMSTVNSLWCSAATDDALWE